MKIGIEASAVFRSRKTGVGYYSYNLVKALMKQMPNDEFLLCYISFINRRPEYLNPSPPNAKYKRISLFPGKIYNFLDHYLFALPFDILARARADVFFFPNFFRWPLWLCRKSIVVVHDLGFIETPEYIIPRHRRYLLRRVPQSVRKANHVVAISNSTKRRLVEHYELDPSQISVVEPGVDLKKYRPATKNRINAIKTKYGISGAYLLYLGTIEPRKNISSILRAYKDLPGEIKNKYQLVLAGGKGWLDEEINRLAKEIPTSSLVRTGYVDEGDEAALYSGASIFLYPSNYEGWGMQVLESMACGTPVITANNSSLPEAGGDAAVYLETNSPQSLTAMILELLSSPSRLATMRKRGIDHAKNFTWERSAAKLAGIISSVYKN